MTKIEWTEQTYNPIIGCSKVSEGCKNCYAERMAVRLAAIAINKTEPSALDFYVDVVGRNTSKWTGRTFFVGEALDKPLKYVSDE